MHIMTKLLPVSLSGPPYYVVKWYTSQVSLPSTKNMANIQTFVFLDCETTGLPHLEYNKTRITELCLIGVESDCIALGVYPRVQNKLTLCFNPQKLVSSGAARITGLSNDNLQYQSSFSNDTTALINLFLDKFKKPICLVAHNGNMFDYPILQSELHRAGSVLQDGLLCMDSLLAFREIHEETIRQDATTTDQVENIVEEAPLDLPYELQDGFDEILVNAVECLEAEHNGTLTQITSVFSMQEANETTPPRSGPSNVDPKAPVKRKPNGKGSVSRNPNVSRAINFPRPSFKLGDIYKRLTTKDPEDAHAAEGDVRLLIHCAATLGEKFVTWANTYSQNFSEIPRMMPGKSLKRNTGFSKENLL